jgi:hypothetical protein
VADGSVSLTTDVPDADAVSHISVGKCMEKVESCVMMKNSVKRLGC